MLGPFLSYFFWGCNKIGKEDRQLKATLKARELMGNLRDDPVRMPSSNDKDGVITPAMVFISTGLGRTLPT